MVTTRSLQLPTASRAAHPLRAVLETLGGLFYPPACVSCDSPLEPGEYLCDHCAQEAAPIRAPFCETCSQPFSGAITGEFTCANCRDRDFAFQCAVSTRRHTGLVRDLIVRFKYGGELHLRRPLAAWLAETLDDPRIACQAADALVPVPLHPRRQRDRGFNQAEACCRILERRMGLPVWPMLRRTRFTETQTYLSRDERLQNLRGAFAVHPGRVRKLPVRGSHILLVDDVFTSGATVHECSRVLRKAGAASVRVLTIARR